MIEWQLKLWIQIVFQEMTYQEYCFSRIKQYHLPLSELELFQKATVEYIVWLQTMNIWEKWI